MLLGVKKIRLREARQRLQLTQVMLAAKARVHQSTISKIEVGLVTNPGLDVAVRVARALDLLPTQLDFSAPTHKESA